MLKVNMLLYEIKQKKIILIVEKEQKIMFFVKAFGMTVLLTFAKPVYL